MFFRRITAKPNECLIVIYKRKMYNFGNGASAIIWPWSSYALVPTNALETTFSMQQETEDGISLRFKGIVIYRITNPELACFLFDFSTPEGINNLSHSINDLCLGELRHISSNLTMERCLKERRTTLTEGVRNAIVPVIEGTGKAGDANMKGWGVKIDVVQVAQVFLVDNQILQQIQSEARERYRKTEQMSKIKAQQEIDFAGMQLEKEKAERSFEIEKEELELKKQSQEIRAAFDRERIATESALKILESEKTLQIQSQQAQAKKLVEKIEKEKQLEIERMEMEKRIESERFALEKKLENEYFRINKDKELSFKELELRKIKSQINAIETQDMVTREKALVEIKKEILPIEQIPEIAEALSGIFANSNLSFYGGENPIVNSMGMLSDLVVNRLKEIYQLKESKK